jgi:integrase
MPVTASRLRSRIAMVLAYAAVREGWAQSNPATWLGGLPAVLPSPRAIHQVKPMRAAPFRTLPGIVARLDDTRMCDRALLWTLTTVARTGEVFQATLEQVDTWNRIWHLPRGTTKNGEPRRIPLHPKMVPWLHRPGPLSPGLGRSAMLNRLKELSPGVTVHGIRSAFADWCSDVAEAQEELVEQALGPHTHPNATWRAYARSDLLERRRRSWRSGGRTSCSARPPNQSLYPLAANP